MHAPLTEETRSKLAAVSTATLTTALFKHGLRNCFIQDVHPVGGLGRGGEEAGASRPPNMVGPAYTMRYIPAREDLDHIGVFSDRSHPQRKGVEECPAGHVFVIDSRGDARAASAGAILLARLWRRGCAGIVTDGGFRDSPELADMNFPAYHQRPSAPTNLTLHQAIDIDVPIGCGDVAVFPGDVIVGDAEGVFVIPAHLADEIASEAVEMTAFEDFVAEEVLKGRPIIGLYPPTQQQSRDDFATWRQANHR